MINHSMLVFSGLLSSFFFTFIMGLVFSKVKSDLPIEDYLVNAISKSLFLSWTLVFISYWFNLPSVFWVLFVSVAILLLKSNSEGKLEFDYLLFVVANCLLQACNNFLEKKRVF